jgi:predicted  nucleic acid-binding Zn-ribbon protein
MVTADVAQLSRECNTWREALRSQREDLAHMKSELQKAAAHLSNKEALKEVEHYQNQFHIQLINIHDLKQNIKSHEKIATIQIGNTDTRTFDEIVSDHEKLSEEFQDLNHTLIDLKTDFHHFLERT